MPEPAKVLKARLVEMKGDKDAPGGRTMVVQFNPESLKVSFTNQIEKSKGTDQSNPSAGQFVGTGSTKLAAQLWFDVTQDLGQGMPDAKDVRDLTTGVAYFMTAQEPQKKGDPAVLPGVRFSWGSFNFTGAMESMEETLELFSPDGYPLRASVGIVITQQKIAAFNTQAKQRSPGESPQIQAPAGATVQSLAANEAPGRDWQSVAAANGIENPRQLQPGQFLDMQATKPQIVTE